MAAAQTRVGSSASKMACFEALRGLASLAVVVGHVILCFWPGLYFRRGLGWAEAPVWAQLLASFPGKYLWDGHLAVSLFFVLSGFVLSLSYFQSGATASLGSAAVRRYPRLMLPVAASVLFACLLMQLGAMCNQAAVEHMNAIHGLPRVTDMMSAPGASNKWLAAYYGFAPHWPSAFAEAVWGAFVQPSNYNRILWTMPLELTGSFLVYGFLALFGSLRNRWLLYSACGGLLLALRRFYLLDFVLGMALCDLWVHNQRSWCRSLPLGPALALLAVGLFLMPWKPVAALLVVGTVATTPRLQTALAGPWLAFLGRVSFGLYLIHMPICCSLGCGVYLVLCRDLGWRTGASIAALICLGSSVLIAWLFNHGVDRPAIAVTRRLDAWLFRPRAGRVDEAPTGPGRGGAPAPSRSSRPRPWSAPVWQSV